MWVVIAFLFVGIIAISFAVKPAWRRPDDGNAAPR